MLPAGMQTETSRDPAAAPLPDGLLVVVKEDCPTCHAVAPVLADLAARGLPLTVYSQDDPAFPPVPAPVDDRDLAVSYRLRVEAVPTLVRVEHGQETGRAVGWARPEWEALTGETGLGPDLPSHRPGCGSRSVEPGIAEELAVRYGGVLRSRAINLAPLEDEIETCFARGWSDGLPVVPPTPARVLAMLAGTERDPQEVVAVVPPNLVACTVEKVAINAVLAGCRPEYLPVVLAAVEAACTERFNIHGVLATTYSVGPIVIVNGPIARAIGMNSGINVLGQGNRANATIGRALQLMIRNVGGGRPGEIDRATHGNPGKYTLCFAEDEAGSPWESLAAERGVPPGASAVTLFAGDGTRPLFDQLSREPEQLARSYAAGLIAVAHPKLVRDYEAFVVVSPEHGRVFGRAGWSKQRVREAVLAALQLPAGEIVRGAGGIAEGMPAAETEREAAGGTMPKFLPDRLWFVHAGGQAGLFSTIIGSWKAGESGSQPVTREVSA